MRKIICPISLGFLCTSFTMIPVVPLAGNPAVAPAPVDEISTAYNSIQLDQYGLSKSAFTYAWKGYRLLLDKKMISCIDYLTICDFSQSSRKKRLYVIDVTNNKLLIHTWVAHGRNSGNEYATQFSNKPESLQSSLGFYITCGTYYGEHGLSLRINGIEQGFNDKAFDRNIVIHGADYVDGARIKSGMYMGRSWGCPAVSQKESTTIINTIKNRTCLFIYHPSRSYLLGSKILNPDFTDAVKSAQRADESRP